MAECAGRSGPWYHGYGILEELYGIPNRKGSAAAKCSEKPHYIYASSLFFRIYCSRLLDPGGDDSDIQRFLWDSGCALRNPDEILGAAVSGLRFASPMDLLCAGRGADCGFYGAAQTADCYLQRKCAAFSQQQNISGFFEDLSFDLLRDCRRGVFESLAAPMVFPDLRIKRKRRSKVTENGGAGTKQGK